MSLVPTAIRVVLYATPTSWRTALSSSATGLHTARLTTPPSQDASLAIEEFEELLRTRHDITTPLHWSEDRPGWWSAQLPPAPSLP